MRGVGHIFLKESLDILTTQTFKDFDVVISDYSVTDVIKEVCDAYTGKLDIKYFRNTDHDQVSKMSANSNNVLRHATGKIIKLLFQDDFLYNEHALEHIAKNFDLGKDHWLVTACEHSRDGKTFYRPFYPRYNDKIHLGRNTISSPSVLALKNDSSLLFFHTKMKWFMDVEYYKRCYNAFGLPKIVNEICAVNRTGAHQTTNTEINQKLMDDEFAMVVREFYGIPVATFLIAKRKIWNTLRKIKKSYRPLLVKTIKPPYMFIKNTIRGWKWLYTEYRSRITWKSKAEIAAYRKTIKVYDVFTLFNELDLLEIRLATLDPYVDHFVILEATRTFSGQDKPLYFEQNKERFKKWLHKIIYYPLRDVPNGDDVLRARLAEDKNLTELDKEIINGVLTSDNVGRGVVHWSNEFYMKESLKKALVGLRDTDFCYVSDLDEFWNPELVIDYSKESVFKLRQTGYLYYLNNRTNEIDWDVWSGTIATQYKNIKNGCLNHLRTHRKMKNTYVFLRNGGWHFGYQGGVEGARKKIVESAHFWYKADETLPTLQYRIDNNLHLQGKDVKLWVDERGLPKHILENKEKYKKFFKV